MHDFRKLIDDLHTENGEKFSLAIEVVDPSAARANEGATIRAEGLTPFGRGFDPVSLTVYDAGVIVDALSGALREITQPAAVWARLDGDETALIREAVEQYAAAHERQASQCRVLRWKPEESAEFDAKALRLRDIADRLGAGA